MASSDNNVSDANFNGSKKRESEANWKFERICFDPSLKNLKLKFYIQFKVHMARFSKWQFFMLGQLIDKDMDLAGGR